MTTLSEKLRCFGIELLFYRGTSSGLSGGGMRDTKLGASQAGEGLCVEETLTGETLAAVLVGYSRDFPPLLRLNARHVHSQKRASVERWAISALVTGHRLAWLTVQDVREMF